MTYNTPELLLVGAAHNLVLGGEVPKIPHFTNTDAPGDPLYNDFQGFDNMSW